MAMWLILLAVQWALSAGLKPEVVSLANDYFMHKNIKQVVYFSSENSYQNKITINSFMKNNIRVSVKSICNNSEKDIENLLRIWNLPIGVLMDGSSENIEKFLLVASKSEKKLFDAMHIWLIITDIGSNGNISEYINERFQELNLSADADIAVVSSNGRFQEVTSSSYTILKKAKRFSLKHRTADDEDSFLIILGSKYIFTDIYNFGKHLGNPLETMNLGTWNNEKGLNVTPNNFKYYNRWDFHNLTMRAVSVILDRPRVFHPEMLTEPEFTSGISFFTKVVAQLMQILMKQHNFRFNYTIAGRWIGSPIRNSTLAVTNSLYWKEQDISCTSARIFSKWLDWVDIYFPPATSIQTKFFYLIPDKGVGNYENQFLTPMSTSVWWCGCAAGIVCIVVLAGAASLENRRRSGLYAFFSVLAAICQQAYEDGAQLCDYSFSSQGRRLTLLVVGLTSMLFYNYYTSSVVSWLLNASPPTLYSLDDLIDSDLELIFEDIGYTRGWLDNTQGYYYSGYKNIKEDELRDAKVKSGKHTVKLLQSPKDGVALIRKGGYAYHTDPYTANQEISKTFTDRDLCDLGSLQMMPPASVYIMGQKRGPYKEFFNWSLMRLLERGHLKVIRAQFEGYHPKCSGSSPKALALGQAAPAFIILAQAALLSFIIFLIEIIWHKYQPRTDRTIFVIPQFRGEKQKKNSLARKKQ